MSFAGTPASAAVDVVGVFDSNFNQLFPDARAMRALVKPSAKLPEHPVEDGSTITDNIIYLPIQIDLSMILLPATYKDTYKQVINLFKQAQTVTIQTTADTYPNMVLQDPPHDENPDMIDTATMALKFREFQFVTAQYQQLPATAVKKPSNATTVKTGQKTGTTATPAQSSIAFDLIFGSKP